ncbi:MAG: O-antigen ligase family protein [Ginsengibacter sp.]
MRLSSSFLLHFFLPILISFFFFIELGMGLNQFLTNLNTSKDLSSAITGSLQNSGVYSYFLIICLPVLFYSLKIVPGSKIIKRIVLIVTLISIVIILISTQSRTAIITFIIALTFLFHSRVNDKVKRALRFIRNNKLVVSLILAGLIIGILYCLIQLRPESFAGRIFIWQTAIRHFPDNLFTGTGIGTFSYYYPQWQIEYFSSHLSPPISYFLNADETHVAFNEPLQVLIETGLVGFMCCVILLIYLFNIKSDENRTFIVTVKKTLILILIAGLSSYPLHCNAILFLLAFCIAGLLATKRNRIIFVIRKFSSFGVLLFVMVQSFIGLVAFNSMNHYLSISKWNSLGENLLMPPSEMRTGYLQLYPFLSTNGKFLLDMGEHFTDVGDLHTAIKVIEESKKYYISTRTFSSTANSYYQANNIPYTIKNLEDLSNMVPHKFYPRYELIKLYYQCGDLLKGNEMAQFILSMPVKKMSPEVDKIKKETRAMLADAMEE